MTRAAGAGWIGARGRGAGLLTDVVWDAARRLEAHLASPPGGREIRNYGRFDTGTRLVCHAVYLALQDAGYGEGKRLPKGTGLIGTGDLGTLSANLAYFRDYCDHDKILGRSSLFLYTLPTSPLAEAAIAYGLGGPLFFVAAGADNDPAPAFAAAADILRAGASPCMLVCEATPTAAIVHVIEAGDDPEGSTLDATLAAATAARLAAHGQDGSTA
jgi:hypothetical protein